MCAQCGRAIHKAFVASVYSVNYASSGVYDCYIYSFCFFTNL